MKKKSAEQKSEEYQNFENAMRQILSVPKSELDKRQAAYERKKVIKKRKAA